MSPQFSELDRWAKAAQAAYARFDLRPNEIDALTEKDTGAFVNGEASRFAGLPPRDPFGPVAQGFQFLDHQPDELSGFSATTFLDRTSGKYVLAIRGTAGLADYAEDLNRIGIQGFAGDQMVSLYRYYKRLTTPAGQSVSYNDAEISILQSIKTGVPISPASAIFSAATTAALRAQLALDRGEQGLTGSGSSVLPAGAPLIVTGHSLGGHLALLFGRFFPEVTEHVYTYNAPGISAVGEFALRAMGVPPSPPSLVTNVASELGGEAISRIWSKPGDIVGIATEPGSLLHQHSIVPLADTLALYGAFEMLSPDSPPDAAAVTGIIQAASPLPYDGIEVLVDELGQLLGTDIASTPIAYTSADRDARDAYFRNLFAVLDGREPGRDYQIISLVGKSAAELEKLAASEIGVRYALSSLQAFAAKNADYSGFADSHSGEWLASRAEWLEAELRGNVADQPFAVGADGKSILFRDLDIGRTYAKFAESQVAQFPQSPGVSDVEWLDGLMASATYDGIVTFGLSDTPNQLSGRLGDDRLFGGDAADTLVGDAGDDYLEGGAGDDRLLGDAGDDTLVGGAGADRLEGGAGADAYVYAESLDGDTIFDTDGRIFVAGAPLVGGRGSAGSYASTDGQYTYGFTGDLLLGGTLTINGTLRVENFHNGDLGIRLGITGEPDDAAPPGPAGGILLLGDYDYRGYTDELTHTQYFGFDEYGNPNADAIATSHPDRVDTYENFEGFPGTPGATHFIAGGGDDIMQDILGGDDWLELGTGDDAGWGGAGDDTVEG
jgi:hypothetical protein